MRFLRRLIGRCRAYIRLAYRRISRKPFPKKCGSVVGSNLRQSSAYQILMPGDSPVGATYAGKEQYRKMKVKDKTETLIMFVRLCDGRMSCVRNRGGYLCYTAIDKIHGLIIELQYKERKAPRNTIATLTINTQGREVFPISKVFFCLKSP